MLYLCTYFNNITDQMREKIDCFLPQGDPKVTEEMAVQLRNSKAVQNIVMMQTGLMSSNALMQD